MGNLTNNFSREEFACRCGCGFDTVDHGLVTMLQDEADHFAYEYNAKVKIEITGPNRCPAHNEAEGGAPSSTHKDAKGADHKVYVWTRFKLGWDWLQIDAMEQFDYLDAKYPTSHGIGIYDNRVHADCRAAKARWDKRVDRST